MTQHLQTQPNFGIPGQRYRHAYSPGDDFYEALIDSHRGLDDAQSQAVNARLILLLANHIGDLRVLREALAAARQGVAPVPATDATTATNTATNTAANTAANTATNTATTTATGVKTATPTATATATPTATVTPRSTATPTPPAEGAP